MTMEKTLNRRVWLQAASAGGLWLGAGPRASGRAADPTRVVVWDERQPAQKQAYENFLGNQIADYLRGRPGLEVQSVGLDDPEQGLGKSVLEAARVLVWWGHVRQAEVTPETGKAIVTRIQAGTLSLIALHSAHWSTPFVEAMNERSRHDLQTRLGTESPGRLDVKEVPPPQRYTVPKPDARLTPYSTLRKFPDDSIQAELHLPDCCFPAYRNDGKPSQVRILKPEHPIAAGLPRTFELPHTEMYNEPFHVPAPDEVIFEERWASGEWFRSGMVWRLGKGRVVYVRPGHETFAVYKEATALRIVENTVRWLGAAPT
jgi:trehalose utilization protein